MLNLKASYLRKQITKRRN